MADRPDDWFPTALYIGGVAHEVRRSPDHLGSRNMGLYDPPAARITVFADLTPDQARTTLLHECIEAINNMAELRLEHAQLSKLEMAIDALFVQNPCLLRLYLDGAERWWAHVSDARGDASPCYWPASGRVCNNCGEPVPPGCGGLWAGQPGCELGTE